MLIEFELDGFLASIVNSRPYSPSLSCFADRTGSLSLAREQPQGNLSRAASLVFRSILRKFAFPLNLGPESAEEMASGPKGIPIWFIHSETERISFSLFRSFLR